MTEARNSTITGTPRRPAVSVATFRNDPLFPRIELAVATILQTSKVVTPIDVIVGMELLTRVDVENWQQGRVTYLERVITCNLTRLARLLRILRFHAHDLNLKPSTTIYVRHGKGPKQRLRFTKSGDAKLESVFATHFVWLGKSAFGTTHSKNALPSKTAGRSPALAKTG